MCSSTIPVPKAKRIISIYGCDALITDHDNGLIQNKIKTVNAQILL